MVTLFATVAVACAAWFGARALVNSKQEKQMDRYEWLSQRTAPPFCPISVESSSFLYRGGGSLYITPGDASDKRWGESYKSDVVGPRLKRLPDRLSITFHSAWEDKIYRGDFALPYERIAKLFAEGFQSLSLKGNPHVTYDTIIAGVTPGGGVAVWGSGIGRQTEVFFGQASETELDWHATYGFPREVDRRALVARSLAELPDNATTRAYREYPPFGLGERWRKRYAWQPVFENVVVPAYLFPVLYVNGEKDDVRLPETAAPEGGRAVPSKISLDYLTVPGDESSRRFFEATFDQDEIIAAFERLGKNDEALELVLRRDGALAYKPTEILLRNRHESVRLEKTTFWP